MAPMYSTVEAILTRLVLISSLLLASACAAPPPSNDELRSRFFEHRQSLDTLATMMRDDFITNNVREITPSLIHLVNNGEWPRPESEWGLTRARWEEYRRLFSQVGLSGVRHAWGGASDSIALVVWSSEGPQERGFMHSSEPRESYEYRTLEFTVTTVAQDWQIYALSAR